MQKTDKGLLLTRREALTAHRVAEERGFPELGQAATQAMMSYYFHESGRMKSWQPHRFDGVRLRGLLRNSASRPEGFFHLGDSEVGEVTLKEAKDACEPTENIEREIDSFVSFTGIEFRRHVYVATI
jgi:hypothetical protein